MSTNFPTIRNNNGNLLVSARDLHTYLGVSTEFAKWASRMFEYGFNEDVDYSLVKIGERNYHNKIDYALTLDCAKQIAMLQRTNKGRDVRQYFINAEKELHQSRSNQIVQPIDHESSLILISQLVKEQLQLLQDNKVKTKELEATKEQLRVNAPKVNFANAIIGSNTSCLIGELAKILTQNGVPMGQNRLFVWLRENGYLGTRGERYNIPHQQYVENGYFELKKGVRNGSDGVLHTTITPKVTPKGQQYFINKFLKVPVVA